MFPALRPFWTSAAMARGVIVQSQGAKEEACIASFRCYRRRFLVLQQQQCASYRRYTPEETKEVLRLVERHGKNWAYIGSLLDRSDMSVRQAYERVACPTYYRAWSNDELETLKTLVLAHGDDWNTIRDNMPHERPISILKTKWREKVNPELRKGPFSPEEHARLEEAVSLFGNDWQKIALLVKHRTAKQCKSAWEVLKHNSQQAGARYERFSPEEDQALLDAVQKHGVQDFKVVRDAMKSTRWPTVLRRRYFEFLDPAIDRSPWTEEEEKQVYELYQQFNRRATSVKMYLGSKRSRRDIAAHCRRYEKKIKYAT